MKIQEGCDRYCSYCIIPYVRGPVRSMPMDAVKAEAKRLADAGYQEIVLTGIHMASYGRGTEDTLIDAIRAVHDTPGVERVRLGSLEPRTITEEFCRRAAKLPNLCPHFHLSLQSGCDATLKRMNRKYDSARYKESVDLLNAHFDRPAVTTDLIVGFPGETEEEFSATLAFVRSCAFAEMHIFPYSIRTGTPAAEMAQVAKNVKEERAARAAAVAKEMRETYLRGCVGKMYPVIYEQTYDGLWHGHAPNYVTVAVSGEALHNVAAETKIIGVDGDLLLGELVLQ
jgi:threonylcarbamoyladenosine tRNA methylthiotransferase MtaB